MSLGSEIRDPRSGVQNKPIPDPGSRGQKGTQSRIPDPDPQHCLWVTVVGLPAIAAFLVLLASLLFLSKLLLLAVLHLLCLSCC
jgi:hypothetical protein